MKKLIAMFIFLGMLFYAGSGCLACKSWESTPEPEDEFPDITPIKPSDWSIPIDILSGIDTKKIKQEEND